MQASIAADGLMRMMILTLVVGVALKDEEDFFSSFGAKPTSSTGLKIGGLKAASKPGGKGKLVMPSKSKNKPSIAAPKPAVKKLTKDDDVDGWDDF